MAKNLKSALEKNAQAANELDRALRDCISALRDAPDNVVEGRFTIVSNAHRANSER